MPKDHPMYISSQSIWGGAGDTDLGFLFFFSFDWPVFMEHLLCDRCYARHVC